ncbi:MULTISPECIES: hypothetical protein [unclassified Bradyrhizobium]|uniref:hypothetical protein n=1 Tax=unclassified Bradyrhizobium TaxID=2631580 RepID=UPI0028F0803E|nr:MULTISPECIES: hypothetical protein [unclassified Bradyrhizobium]
MWWKIAAFLYALGYSWAVFDAMRDATAIRVITTAFLFPAVASLFLFAFDRRLFPRPLWKAYAIMFVIYWGFPLGLGAKTLIEASGVLVYVILIALCVLFLLPVAWSLWWLSFARADVGPPRPTEVSVP